MAKTNLFAAWFIALAFSLGAFGLPSSALAEPPVPTGDLSSPNFTFDVNAVTHKSITGGVKQGWIRQGVNYFLSRIVGFMAGVIGTLSVLVMTYGGFLILSSAGSDQYQRGVDYIRYSAIGLAVTLGAYILVNAVQLLVKSIYG